MQHGTSSFIISKQIIRSAVSIGANYRAACRAKSEADHINKLKIVEEETDETIFWLEILEDCKMLKPETIQEIKKETNEILAIVVATIKSMREKSKGKS